MENDKKMIFSKLVDPKFLPDDFNKLKLPNYGFELDIFQKQGIYLVDKKESCFVAAHTSSGKTLIAHHCIQKAIQNGERVIYTSPIKALSNQKYYEFRNVYSKEEELVGIITGDVQINEDAPVLIMTTEILRNRLFKNNIQNLGYVIFDEIHYLNDKERGVVWEESIIQLGREVCLLFLSATISNPLEFSEWVGRLKNRTIYVIKTEKRIIPLKYIFMKNLEYTDINGSRIKELNDDKVIQNVNIIKKNKKEIKKTFSLTNFIQKIRKDSFPCIFFCFSKNKCEEYLKIVSSSSFIQILERKKILEFINKYKIKSDYTKYWLKGVAVHHGGLLPTDKEVVELLFQKNLLKILFATETMAMGLNMPAKSVIFLHPFKNGKILQTTSFLQMSGRAGRRGLDTEGKVYINCEHVSREEMKKIIFGRPEPLISSFRITFNLILILMKSGFDIPHYLKSSFGELSAQRISNVDISRKNELQDSLSKLNLEENKNIDDQKISNLLKLIRSINSANFLNKAEWVIDYKGNCGIIDNITTDRIYFTKEDTINSIQLCEKDKENKKDSKESCKKDSQDKFDKKDKENKKSNQSCNKNLKIPFLDSLEITPIDFINKKDCFLVGRDKISWESCKNFLKSSNASSQIISLNFLKNLQSLDLLEKNINEIKNCENFRKKYEKYFSEFILKNELKSINYRLGDESIILKFEYESRIKFLKDLGYLEGTNLTLKGIVASEIRTLNDIIITEMLFNNDFDKMEGEKILSLFSCMICNERPLAKTKTKIKDFTNYYTNENIEKKDEKIDLYFLNYLEDQVKKINNLYEQYGIKENIELNYTAVKPVFLWCKMNDLNRSVENEISKGGFVRVILRIYESIREIQNVCNILQNNLLLKKLIEFENVLVRDIILQESLYFQK